MEYTRVDYSVKIVWQTKGTVVRLSAKKRRKQKMKSYMATASTIERKWYIVDAEGQTLGRLASEVAKVLRGKNKPTYTPHIDTGDYVIVVNAEKIRVSGNKLNDKVYYHHSGYVGGLKSATLKEKLEKDPTFVVEHAVQV